MWIPYLLSQQCGCKMFWVHWSGNIFLLNNASRNSHKHVRCSKFQETQNNLTMRLCHIIPGVTPTYPLQYPETLKFLPGFYFSFYVLNTRSNDSYAELCLPFPIYAAYVYLWGEIKAGATMPWESRMLGHNPLVSCISALGRTLQEKSYFYQEVLKLEEDLAS